jgi:hypothetical protein
MLEAVGEPASLQPGDKVALAALVEGFPVDARLLAALAHPLVVDARPLVVAHAHPLAAHAHPLVVAHAHPLAVDARPLAAVAQPLAADAQGLAELTSADFPVPPAGAEALAASVAAAEVLAAFTVVEGASTAVVEAAGDNLKIRS